MNTILVLKYTTISLTMDIKSTPDYLSTSFLNLHACGLVRWKTRSAECGVWKMRSAENAECGKCGVWKMRSVENAECGKCGVWKMRGVENAECGKCGAWKMSRKFQFSISI